MIRLAIPENSAVCHDVARRLRGVTVAWGAPTSSDVPPPASCDAIVCLAPARCDARWIERCLAAKKHVLVDAQAWLSAIELETLIAAAQRSDVQLAIENPDRFLPSRQLIRQQLDAGKIGTPGLVRLHRWVPAHADEEVAAGGLPMALIRDIEVVLSLVGTSPNSVYAVERPQPFPPAPGRVLQVHLGFPSGAMALIDYAHCLPAGDDYRSLSVIGSTGAAYADDHHNVQLLYHGGSPQAIRVGEGSRHLVAMVQEFVDCLTADRDRWASAGIWRQVFDVAELAGQALATRQAFELKGA
jgi:predicted dehydrogenase